MQAGASLTDVLWVSDCLPYAICLNEPLITTISLASL